MTSPRVLQGDVRFPFDLRFETEVLIPKSSYRRIASDKWRLRSAQLPLQSCSVPPCSRPGLSALHGVPAKITGGCLRFIAKPVWVSIWLIIFLQLQYCKLELCQVDFYNMRHLA